MWPFLKGSLLLWTALHFPNCTSLYSAGLHSARHCAPGRNTPHCISVGGTAWSGLDSAAPHWTGLLQLAFMELGCSRWKYTAIYLHGWEFTWVDCSERDKTGLDQTALPWIVIDCAWLHQSALHCTVLDWTGNNHTR